MNVDLFKEKLISKTSSSFSWNEDEDSNQEVCYLDTEVEFDAYRHIFDLYVTLYDDNTIIVKFVLGGLEKSDSVLRLVNDFNRNILNLTAFVAAKNNQYILHLRVTEFVDDEDDAVDTVLAAIEYLSNDDVKKQLCPLDVIAD